MKPKYLALILPVLGYNVAHAAPGVITYAVIGSADPDKKLTAMNAVSGAGVSNVDLALPIYILRHGYSYMVTIGMQDYNYAGTCITSYSLGSGTTGATTISNWSTASYSCPATSIWTFPFPAFAMPNKPGPALLTATVKFGTTAVVTKVPLVIQ